jgi:ABC-type multidrug transport system fused ATPase/permease subunit
MMGPPPPMTPEEKRQARRNLFRSFVFMRPVMGLTAVVFCLAALMQVLPLATVYLYQAFFKTFQAQFQAGGALTELFVRTDVVVLFIVLLVLLLIYPVSKFFQEYLGKILEVKILSNIRQRIYEHVQTLSMDAFSRGKTGALMRRILEEPEAVKQLLTEVALLPAIDLIVLLLVVGYLLIQNVWLTLILLACIPVYMITFLITNARLQVHAETIRDAERDLATNVEETVNGISDIQLFNAETRRSREFGNVQARTIRGQVQLAKWFGISGEGAMTINTFGRLVMLAVGFWMMTRGTLRFDQLFAFFALSEMLFEPALRLVAVNNLYQSLVPVLEGTWELLDQRPEIIDRPGAAALDHPPQKVTFDSVEFAYAPGQPVLKDFSFELERGTVTALVGPIGCGKSTTFNLLLRFLEPQGGRVLLDGSDVHEFTVASLRQEVSKLSQFPIFFKESIRENIRFSRPGASDADIEDAARMANIHDTIVGRIDGGYNSVVAAQYPSGGQKRLIALARCFLRKPAVLLLDEPTANLDLEEKDLLKRVIRDYSREAVVMIIDHDINFIADVADRILVMDGGRIVEQGDHEQLMASQGLYSRFHTLSGLERDGLVPPPAAPEPPPMMPMGGPMGGPMMGP